MFFFFANKSRPLLNRESRLSKASFLTPACWHEVFHSLFNYVVERDLSESLLLELLSLGYDGVASAKLDDKRQKPINDRALMKACAKNDYG